MKNPKHGEFLSAVLQQTGKDQPGVHVEGLCSVNQGSFWFDGKKWRFAKKGDMALGTVKAVSGGVPGIRGAENLVGME